MPLFRKLNKDFFKKWTPEMAYILGFFCADGNIVKTKRKTHFISFYTSDKDLICYIKLALGSGHKIKNRKSKNGKNYRIQIGSKEMFEDLINLGVTPNKSRRMSLPKVPDKLFAHFARGYFDGDGNVWVGKTNKGRKTPTSVISSFFTSCSYEFLSSLHKKLKKITNGKISGGCIYRPKVGDYSRLQFSTLDSLNLYDFMYNHRALSGGEMCLQRKRIVFERFIKMRS